MQAEQTQRSCCFIGHRRTPETEELAKRVYSIVEDLILRKNVETFLFGSKSRFNSLCYEQTTKLKEKYPHIRRIYVRAEFSQINESYLAYLLERYEQTYYPKKAIHAGKAAYILRNREMIDKSEFCVVYFQEACLPKARRSGTKAALDYAIKRNKAVILLP